MKQDVNWVAKTMRFIQIFLFLIGIVVLVKIVLIKFTFNLGNLEPYFQPKCDTVVIAPVRGNILDHNGKILAMSNPRYTLHMDCAIHYPEYKKDKKKEEDWRKLAKESSKGLERFVGHMSAAEYYKQIISNRENGNKYWKICENVYRETLDSVMALPLFQKGNNYSGLIVKSDLDSRSYPYGYLARTTVGRISRNSDNVVRTNGIEGKFNEYLCGHAGSEAVKQTDKRKYIKDYGKKATKVEDGQDIRTTLDVNLQDIADRAIREKIDTNYLIEGACAIVMEVETGAIRAMVNLKRDSIYRSPLREYYNYALLQSGEPGSVFKTVTLTSVIEDGYIQSLEETLPTNHGVIGGKYPIDSHIGDYEKETGLNQISIKHGFEISSNYVFAKLAIDNYGENPQAFFDNIRKFRLADAFEFDIDGLRTPTITYPDSKLWSGTSLGTTAYGYSSCVTPLHVVTFYNAIGNGGKMMKPYIIESIEKNGHNEKKFKPEDFGQICSKSTADTVKAALYAVTHAGTAKKLRNSKLEIAGKTGTARVIIEKNEKPMKGNPYMTENGRRKYQGTFVGFFPVDKPKYTVLVTIYSRPSRQNFYGGGIPAAAVKDIVSGIYSLERGWGEEIVGKTPFKGFGNMEKEEQ